MKTVCIIQARMGSTRLPGKVLADVAGRPMLAQQLRRLRRCALLDEIVLATTDQAKDDPLSDLARREGAGIFRGDEQDVLSRFVGAAREARADVVVRVTADCPLIDPEVAGRVVRELTDNVARCDYASNVVERTFPRGLDVEAFFVDALARMDRLARTPAAREHVTLVPRSERPDLFLLRSVVDGENNADLRWTVDTEDDLRLVRALYEGLDLGSRPVPYRELLAHVRARPELVRMNAHVETWAPPVPAGPRVRPARPEDSRLVWEWANDPDVRAASFSSEPIPWERHAAWFDGKLKSPDTVFFIVVDGAGAPLGQVRFDGTAGRAVISIGLARGARGKGLGARVIETACQEFWKAAPRADSIMAHVKTTNGASERAFLRAGFLKAGAEAVNGCPAVQLVLKRAEA